MYENEKKELTTKEKVKSFWKKWKPVVIAGGVLVLVIAVDDHATKRCSRRYTSCLGLANEKGILSADGPTLLKFMEEVTVKELEDFWKKNTK